MKHGLSIYSHRLSDGFNDGCNTHQAPDQRRPGNRNPCPKSWRSQILFSKVSEEPTKTPREKSACPFWKSGFFGSIASFEIQGGFGDVDTKQLATEHLWSVVQNHIIQTERWIQFHGVFWSFWPPNMACCLKIGGKPHTHTRQCVIIVSFEMTTGSESIPSWGHTPYPSSTIPWWLHHLRFLLLKCKLKLFIGQQLYIYHCIGYDPRESPHCIFCYPPASSLPWKPLDHLDLFSSIILIK